MSKTKQSALPVSMSSWELFSEDWKPVDILLFTDILLKVKTTKSNGKINISKEQTQKRLRFGRRAVSDAIARLESMGIIKEITGYGTGYGTQYQVSLKRILYHYKRIWGTKRGMDLRPSFEGYIKTTIFKERKEIK